MDEVQKPSSFGLGFEAMMDENENLFVKVHVTLGMVHMDFVIPESQEQGFIQALKGAFADAAKGRSEFRANKGNAKQLLDVHGNPMTLSPEREEELRAIVTNASKIDD